MKGKWQKRRKSLRKEYTIFEKKTAEKRAKNDKKKPRKKG